MLGWKIKTITHLGKQTKTALKDLMGYLIGQFPPLIPDEFWVVTVDQLNLTAVTAVATVPPQPLARVCGHGAKMSTEQDVHASPPSRRRILSNLHHMV